jgi:hypothetical protein
LDFAIVNIDLTHLRGRVVGLIGPRHLLHDAVNRVLATVKETELL